MDEDSLTSYFDKVESWRREQLQRFFPDMADDQVEDLAVHADRFVLEVAEKLSKDGCPAALAYRIMRPLPH